MTCPNCGYPLSNFSQPCPRCNGLGQTQPVEQRPRFSHTHAPALAYAHGPLLVRHRLDRLPFHLENHLHWLAVVIIGLSGWMILTANNLKRVDLTSSKAVVKEGKVTGGLFSLLPGKSPSKARSKKRANPDYWPVPKELDGGPKWKGGSAGSADDDGITKKAPPQVDVTVGNNTKEVTWLRLLGPDSSEHVVRLKPGETIAEVPAGKYTVEIVSENPPKGVPGGTAVVKPNQSARLKIGAEGDTITLKGSGYTSP